jgi:LuxR family maltose regulon positive regulatory protein
VMDIGVRELAMDRQEARALLEAAGLQLDGVDAAELLRRTEGWPVGLYLAALAHKASGPPSPGGPVFSGDDRFMVESLWSELLGRLPAPTVSFLTRTSMLERMCGSLCDAVLDTTGSNAVLASLEDSNLLLVPLDRHGQWYRYHQLFRDLLRAELERREPELMPLLHTRAAIWHEANGLPETAIAHAQAAGDPDRVARLVTTRTQPAYAGGRVETARQWLAWFEDQGLIQQYPSVAVHGAWLEALGGEPAAAEHWAAAAEREPAGVAQPDNGSRKSYLALLRALLCRDGVDHMRADAQVARTGLGPDDPWQATALLLEGIAYLLGGQADQADPILAQAVDVAIEARAAPAAATGLAERSIVAMEHDEWDDAAILAEQALGSLWSGHLDDYAMSPLVHAVAARTALYRSDAPTARRHLAQAARQRTMLTYAMPHRAVQTLLELVRAYLALGDAAAARVVLRDARDILLLRPDLGVLPGQADELHAQLDRLPGPGVTAMPLTSAELRLLPLLATHLSFREMGEQLFLSQHTVKAQALSVYRKLGVSSRSQAVQHAQRAGLSS